MTPIKEGKLVSSAYKSFDECIAFFLKDYKETADYPKFGCVGIAGPVDEVIKVTNLSWSPIKLEESTKNLNFLKLDIINDFVANGYGVLDLKPESYMKLNDKPIIEGKPKALIGAGTGLGEAYATASSGSAKYIVFPSEGGHADFAPRNKFEFEYLKFVM